MENLVKDNLFGSVYANKTVLVTGHTGFKGSWLCLWLTQMGANVIGYSLEPNTTPNHYSSLNLDMTSIIADIRDQEKLESVFNTYQPEIIFHLAAQPLVRKSYKEPVETFEINVMGTIKLFELARHCESVKAIVNVTSDKCYENSEWIWGYRENDPMGGYDPYSASKGCSELVTNAYRNSYFNVNTFGVDHNILLASCRAGNVIGGGDWSEDRLVPDIIRAIVENQKVSIRNPNATRPWEHVLEPLSGYLCIGQKLLEQQSEFAGGWNFGPSDEASINVESVVKNIKKFWDKIDYEINQEANQPHEANLLKLDCSKAHVKLQWKDVWSAEQTFEKTILWYKKYYENDAVSTVEDLKQYIKDAKEKNLAWTLK